MQFAALRRGKPGPLKPPTAKLDPELSAGELAESKLVLRESAVGSEAAVKAWFEQFLARTRVDELVLTSHVYDHQARIKSFSIAAKVLQEIIRVNNSASL